MSLKTYSLRRRLSVFIVLVVALIWIGSAAISFDLAHDEADTIFDAQIYQATDFMLALAAGNDLAHFSRELADHAIEQAIPFVFEIHHREAGQLTRIAASVGMPAFPALPDGFSETRYAGKVWRFNSVWDAAGQYNVRVGMPEEDHEMLETRIAERLLAPILIALPLLLAAIGWAVGRALRPLDALTRQVSALNPAALTPLRTQGRWPAELAPLARALNAAIDRVDTAFDNERRFTADAAHELRTPLAALKIQAQVAARAHGSEREHALAQLTQAVDRMTHLVEQMLTLARLQPDTATVAAGVNQVGVDRAAVDLAAPDMTTVAADVCASLAAQADRQGQHLELDCIAPCHPRVDASWLASVLNNLVGNALLYAGRAATVRVILDQGPLDQGPLDQGALDQGQLDQDPTQAGTVCRLRVLDNGPGVPQAERARLLARFARGEAAWEVEGCGLGLSIVARIAEASGGEFSLIDGLQRDDGGHGFGAELRWPLYSDGRPPPA